MKFIFHSGTTFDEWDWRNPATKGIGGSETHHIELVERLAARGHDVWSYAPVRFRGVRWHGGVRWETHKHTNFRLPGIWVIARDPVLLDKFRGKSKRHQKVWFIAQDSFYTTWTDKRIRTCDRIFALCEAQKRALLAKHPLMAGKVIVSSNGIPTDRIEAMWPCGKTNNRRNPCRLIYTSSPDRGLVQLLHIFRRAREYVPKLELHCFYGFNNINRIIKANPAITGFLENKKEILSLLRQPGVHWHGRISQPKLWRQWLRAGLWCYPANFTETSCISAMEAQALGAIPICNPIWAVRENVKHGVFVDRDVNDPLARAEYAAEVVRLATQPDLQNIIRASMMPWARQHFDWNHVATQFEQLVLEHYLKAPSRPVPLPGVILASRLAKSFHAWAGSQNGARQPEFRPLMQVRMGADGMAVQVAST